MRFVPSVCALGLGLVLLGCSSSSATAVITRPELMAVSPDDFLGDLRCGDGSWLVGSYVATLLDVSPAIDANEAGLQSGFPLPSSPATSCNFPVTFGLVVDTHRYRAQIDAFDRLPQSGPSDPDLRHIVAVTEGGRPQQDGNQRRVEPRWTATCTRYPFNPSADAGAGAGGTVASGGESGADTRSDFSGGGLPGLQSRDAITIFVHNCESGLELTSALGE